MKLQVPGSQQILAHQAEFGALADTPAQARVEPGIAGCEARSSIRQLSYVSEIGIPLQVTAHVPQGANLKLISWPGSRLDRQRLYSGFRDSTSRWYRAGCSRG